MPFFCTLCPFRCTARLQLIQHSFQTHSVEPTFHFVCGIKGCLHTFKVGATYSSFKSHACRKHPNWQEHLDETVAVPSPVASLPDISQDNEPICTEVDEVHLDIDMTRYNEPISVSQPLSQSSNKVQRTAALFLLTFQEKYRLSEASINFAVGSINSIVEGACEAARIAVEKLLESDASPSSIDLRACFEHQDDAFASLHTKYQQSKFYRDTFGLVVS